MARKYPVAENSFSRVLLGEAGQLAISRVAAALRSEGFDGVEDWSEQLKTEKTFPTRKSIARSIAGKYKVPYALVLHGIYGRGDPRVPKHITYHPNSSNEVSWLPIISIEKGLKKDVYDVVTGDNASCFFANGILAHNCGVRAAKLDVKFADIEPDLKTYLHAMKRRIPIGLGKQHEKPVEHEIFDRDEWSEAPLNSIVGRDGQTLKEIAQLQIGSAGSGNHFYEILEDENGDAWTLIHFGSRSPGYKTAEYFIKLAEKENPTETGLSWLSMDGDAGQTYWHVHQLARDFAYAGRNMVGEAMRDVLGARELQVVHNHHNFAGVEEHQGEKLYVHRKGATPAGLGEAGIIPGSMGDSSYIVEGLGNEESLRSSSHGAGRVMSRTAAHGKRDKRTGEWKTRPRVTEGAMKAWLKKEGVVLLGGDLDESPHVYKRINEVMAAQTELVRPITKLRPRGVIMSPPDPRKAKMRMRTKPIDDA